MDTFKSLKDLKKKVASDLLPGFRLTLDKDEMDERQYITIQYDLIPAMDNIVRISKDCTFIMYKHSNIIPKSKLQSIHIHIDRFTRVSHVTNALALLKYLQVSNSNQIKKAEKVLQGLDLETLPLEYQQLLSLMKMQFDPCQQRRITGGLPLTSSSSVLSSTDLAQLVQIDENGDGSHCS